MATDTKNAKTLRGSAPVAPTREELVGHTRVLRKALRKYDSWPQWLARELGIQWYCVRWCRFRLVTAVSLANELVRKCLADRMLNQMGFEEWDLRELISAANRALAEGERK